MPLEALLIPENLTESDSDGIGGGTGVIFYFYMHISFRIVAPIGTQLNLYFN